MTLLAVERIKLFSTRSPFWCAAVAIGLAGGLTALIVANSPAAVVNVPVSQGGYGIVLPVIMVMAALAVTTEYRFGTIRATFQAVPDRKSVLLAKTAVVALVTGLLGEITAFGSWGLARLIKPAADLGLDTAAEWRQVAGIGLIYAITSVLAVSVGILLRHTAGAIAALLIYSMVVENLVLLIPKVGENVHKWMPFQVADRFLSAGAGSRGPDGPPFAVPTMGPWWALAYFAGVAAVFLITALLVADRRDA